MYVRSGPRSRFNLDIGVIRALSLSLCHVQDRFFVIIGSNNRMQMGGGNGGKMTNYLSPPHQRHQSCRWMWSKKWNIRWRAHCRKLSLFGVIRRLQKPIWCYRSEDSFWRHLEVDLPFRYLALTQVSDMFTCYCPFNNDNWFQNSCSIFHRMPDLMSCVIALFFESLKSILVLF